MSRVCASLACVARNRLTWSHGRLTWSHGRLTWFHDRSVSTIRVSWTCGSERYRLCMVQHSNPRHACSNGHTQIHTQQTTQRNATQQNTHTHARARTHTHKYTHAIPCMRHFKRKQARMHASARTVTPDLTRGRWTSPDLTRLVHEPQRQRPRQLAMCRDACARAPPALTRLVRKKMSKNSQSKK